MSKVSIKYYANANVELVKSLYAKTTYRNTDSVIEGDEIVAAFIQNEIVGILRICYENSVFVLRGFNVLTANQGKGIGTSMLHGIAYELSHRECYLICKKQLNPLYAKIGFSVCEANQPQFLIERKGRYKTQT